MDGLPPELRHVSFAGVDSRRVRARPLSPLELEPPWPGQLTAPPRQTAADRFARRVIAAAGIDAEIYLASSLQRRVPASLRALRAPSLESAHDAFTRRRERLPASLSSLLVGVTSFFRDAAAFEALRLSVLPALAEQSGTIRIWSAGCSSGPELYSVAMLLDEAGLLDRAHLLGTDCRLDAIALARAGQYSDAEIESLPQPMRASYVERSGSQWRVAGRLRARIHWRVADLSSVTEPGPWDLILWRNMAIYLTRDAAARMLAALTGALHHNGFLMLGTAERPPARVLTNVATCLYQPCGAVDGVR
jgi:chemotaxis methyl-accepting protein methylase